MKSVIFAALLLVILSGCMAKHSSYGEINFHRFNEMPLFELINSHKLICLSDPEDRNVVLQNEYFELVLCDGIFAIYVNQELIPLHSAPRKRYNGLYIPIEVDTIIKTMRESDTTKTYSKNIPIIVLDPGHGGEDTGAQAYGLDEKEITLDLAKRTSYMLQLWGIDTLLTRESDLYVELASRADFANGVNADAFISIHLNAFESDRVDGIETFILCRKTNEEERISESVHLSGSDKPPPYVRLQKARNGSHKLAASMQKSLVYTLELPNRGIKERNFRVLRNCYFAPAILAEVCFMTSARTGVRLYDDDYREQLSIALAKGIIEFLTNK